MSKFLNTFPNGKFMLRHHRFGKFLKGLASENRLAEVVHAVPTFFPEPPCLGVSLRYPLLQLAQGERFGVIFIFRFVTNHPLLPAVHPEADCRHTAEIQRQQVEQDYPVLGNIYFPDMGGLDRDRNMYVDIQISNRL